MGDVSNEQQHDADDGQRGQPAALTAGSRRAKRSALVAFLLFCALLCSALGVWQVERRAWKLALIDAVNERVKAPDEPAPGPRDWPRVNAQSDAYRHVRAEGVYLYSQTTLVRAVTELGEGFWVVTPLRTGQGWTVLINRGFVPDGPGDPRRRIDQPRGAQHVSGLLRVTEPRGALLRANDPAADRWYSRDVSAIATKRGLGPVAPYFVDAGATAAAGHYPVGGLTVIRFRNAHLAYALTWFSLAALSLFMLARLRRMTDPTRS